MVLFCRIFKGYVNIKYVLIKVYDIEWKDFGLF